MKFKRIFVVLATVAVPAIAQNADKAARQAEKQVQKAAAAGGASQNVAPANAGAQKALPSSGGMPAGSIALLGAGALLVGSGVLVYRKSAGR